MSKLTLPVGYIAKSQAERIYTGKLLACYTKVLAQHVEHQVPTALEAQKLALLVAVAESFQFKTCFLQVSTTLPDSLFEPAEGELSPYEWLCLLVATSTMHSSKLDLANAARKAERLLERKVEAQHGST